MKISIDSQSYSKLVTCVDSDEDIENDVAYDLKVPNESWGEVEFKSSHDRPRPVGCSSDSPDSRSYDTSSSGPDKSELLHYDSLEEEPDNPDPDLGDPEPVNVVIQPKQKRSLPPIPKDHNLQQQRAYEILRQQWQNQNDSLEDLATYHRQIPCESRHVEGHSYQRHVEGHSSDDYVHQPHSLNLTSKRQLPKGMH